MPSIYDNIEEGLLPALRVVLSQSQRIDACVGYFNLRGWGSIADLVESAADRGPGPNARILIGMQSQPHDEVRDALAIRRGTERRIDNQKAISLARAAAQELRRQLTFGIPSTSDEGHLQLLARQLRESRVQTKVFLRHRLHAKLYLCHREDVVTPIVPFLGSSNLTFSGLQGQGELNIDVEEQDAARKLAGWFQERWDDQFCLDISQELAEIIEESWANESPLDPYLIYIKMAYHLSSEARAGLTEFAVPVEFEGKLLEFQAAALRIAARHLDRRGGVMVGDVVGFGKTLIGTALAKLYQENYGSETLILCPKNLVEMWEGYVETYRLYAKVLPLSQAHRLSELRRYRVVLIDESHNLRNRSGRTYEHVRDYVHENGSKCILLSATPYNKSFLDLSAQLRLFLRDDEDLGVRPERLIREIGELDVLSLADGRLNSLRAFEASPFADDWRELMRLYLVRRTRSFIKENYAEEDDGGRPFLSFSDGTKFYLPQRVANVIDLVPEGPNDPYAALFSDSVVDTINSLELPRYGLQNYLKADAETATEEDAVIKDLSRAGKGLLGFTRTGLFKRLESSGSVFLESIRRHVVRNFMLIHALETDQRIPVGSTPNLFIETDDDLLDKELEVLNTAINPVDSLRAQGIEKYEQLVELNPGTVRWLRAELFDERLKLDLEADCQGLIETLERVGPWRPESDEKLDALTDLLLRVHPDEKVVVFTEFADTARYIHQQLSARSLESVSLVTGDHEHPSREVHRFSPRSNPELGTPPDEETRVLISTDVLSEGQNLQDAAIVVSYDLPWAIIKLVQRAGRVDRLGQTAHEVLIYTFVPAQGVEEILRLRERVRRRLRENEEVVGSDEAFFADEQREASALRGLYDESGEGLEDDPQDVDLASYAYQVWRNAITLDPSVEVRVTNLPDVVNATRAISHQPTLTPGVLTYLATKNGVDSLVWLSGDGSVVTESPLTILRAAACPPETEGLERAENHNELVAAAAIEIAKQGPVHIEGALTGVRRRIYTVLREFGSQTTDTLFSREGLDTVMDLIYKHPLTEHAKDSITRAIRAGQTPMELADLCLQLHDDQRLTLVNTDDDDDELRIVCSMGLVG